jgi:hypothetical protein
MTTTRTDIEEIGTTRGEKILAVVLTAFLLIGGIWTYTRIDDWTRSGSAAVRFVQPPEVLRANAAQDRLARAQDRLANTQQQLELKREAYRTALEAKKPAGRLEQQYQAAQVAYAAAQREQRAAQAEVRATAPAAERAARDASRKAEERARHDARISFLYRLLLVIAGLVLGLWLFLHLHGRRSRWLPNALALVAAATILAFVLASDYVTDYIAPFDLGPILLALVGAAATLVVFGLLQRYISRRAPMRRLRRGRCPFCGFPARGDHCESCGREVVGECARCGEPRRVGAPHCASCGAV